MTKASHSWKELKIRDGKVMSATPGRKEAEYMATPPIAITKKKEATPERDDPRVAFIFELNHAPDAVWQQLFAENLKDVPPGIPRVEVTVTFCETQLRLLCLASHLERIYPFIKSTIEETNTDYAEEKEAVRQHVATADERKRSDPPTAKAKGEIAREKLTQLEM